MNAGLLGQPMLRIENSGAGISQPNNCIQKQPKLPNPVSDSKSIRIVRES